MACTTKPGSGWSSCWSSRTSTRESSKRALGSVPRQFGCVAESDREGAITKIPKKSNTSGDRRVTAQGVQTASPTGVRRLYGSGQLSTTLSDLSFFAGW